MLQKMNEENFQEKAFRFRDRQAGVSVIYDPFRSAYTYNAYCLETKIMKELFTVEFDFLDEALELMNDEFGSWELIELSEKSSGCSSCVAK
ncbi:MAG: hypothetical protein EOP10_09795 [Proteobacteria bacterium]|nr:MAG: hypothetical protein EOP10_09795 [Pseudomonadota bacterium]